MRIAVVAPSNPLGVDVPPRINALTGGRAEIVFHPQCFLEDGHFAGSDQTREDAFVEVANDPAFDAIWFARGGYGANRIAERAAARLGAAARGKLYLGYSDTGFVLAALDRAGLGRLAHGPMPSDIRREGGEGAVTRALDWLTAPTPAPRPQAAFNLTVLSSLLGTPLEPDLAGRVLMIEEVDEELYRIDRMLFHVTASANVRASAGLMLGRVAAKPNDRDFGRDEDDIAKYWCDDAGVPWLGRADIGHDAANTIIPFG